MIEVATGALGEFSPDTPVGGVFAYFYGQVDELVQQVASLEDPEPTHVGNAVEANNKYHNHTVIEVCGGDGIRLVGRKLGFDDMRAFREVPRTVEAWEPTDGERASHRLELLNSKVEIFSLSTALPDQDDPSAIPSRSNLHEAFTLGRTREICPPIYGALTVVTNQIVAGCAEVQALLALQ